MNTKTGTRTQSTKKKTLKPEPNQNEINYFGSKPYFCASIDDIRRYDNFLHLSDLRQFIVKFGHQVLAELVKCSHLS